ncbi:MAG: tyrosine-type recombinase/integrase, partial [Solirubrobacteraceae bacterium]
MTACGVEGLRVHQLRHAHAIEMAHEGIPLPIIQRQLGHYAGDPVKCGRLGGMRARRRGSGRSIPPRAVGSRRSGSE